MPVGQCACGHCAVERAKIDVMLKEGKNESEILKFYVDTFGGNQILSEPPNSGSGRVVWMMPIVVGVGGLMTAAYLALRWSSRRTAIAGMPAGIENPEMAARLNDDLRNLD